MNADQLRDAIAVLGVSQGGLADMISMSPRTVRRYCAGKKIPHLVAEKVTALVAAHLTAKEAA